MIISFYLLQNNLETLLGEIPLTQIAKLYVGCVHKEREINKKKKYA